MVSDREVEYLSKKKYDDSWDFKKANTKEFTHCFHSYPAMMIPQVARRIIESYGKNANLLYDPFCGTGTSLVEANLVGINAIGSDLNPLARLIAKAKTTRVNLGDLEYLINSYTNHIFESDFNDVNHNIFMIPNVTNIDYWFSKEVQHKLAQILAFIEGITIKAHQDFFRVAFSETVREVSYVKSGEFKLVRSKELSKKDNLNVNELFIKKLHRNFIGIKDFQNHSIKNAETRILDINPVNLIPNSQIEPRSVDIVLTSPPYGDSKTTVAYGQYSRLSSEWLGFNNSNQVDNILMGGKRKNVKYKFKSEVLNDIISLIHKESPDRSRDVISFYIDYESAIINIAKVVKKYGFVCFVVGNRRVKNFYIPTDEITSEMFSEQGFVHLETIIRSIPNKRMPLKNSPSNKAGEKAPTMKNEFIVICQKA